ncbi:type VI secretion system accessory protein TagJ [Burkholderia gladioli]|uniref:type VI secretion system accessory protein TagJ n=1 Tax=Burkholderia gladioli TaxID=28095 RepID=UPI00163EC8E3|nr:type VI secretion system accessory protein TagJ [Burkholderia gladioli]
MNPTLADTSPADAAALLAHGRLDEALSALSAEVRGRPADASLRVFLFQLLALVGEWDRAANQLKMAAELDERNTLMSTAYEFALRGEHERAAVLAGGKCPGIAGEPAAWHAPLIRALHALTEKRIDETLAQRALAFDTAETVAGSIDGEPFEWIADADPRFGPCLELILKSGYVWAPFSQLRSLEFEAPSDLPDKVWAPVKLTWTSGAESVGFVPCRYAGSERSGIADLALAAGTSWVEHGEDCFTGRGQRMLVTDRAEYPLLDVRSITFGAR